ncbi:hypothetical protein [Nitrincola alkalilacustris]|uniref:hypothetical protein n=1 Tax=Nitrincola alkalilacustris TaxID=1571224 RepID=UPI00124BFF10|nr:hypothetical protein [Nitrincola alkalilacustris]
MNADKQLQYYFELAFSSPLDTLENSRERLCKVAEHVWFCHFVPELDRLSNPEVAAKAAYVVDFLASNHLVESDQKKLLKQQVQNVWVRLESDTVNLTERTFYVNDCSPQRNRDVFAQRWHFASGMRPRELGLFNMQRRVNQSKYSNLNDQ